MAPPSLSTYEAQAQSIYAPQLAGDIATATATAESTKNSLEAEKGQVSTDYQSAVDKLTQNVQDQTGQINQLYSERLGGNFSGLQGNDLGQMFARANEQQSIIEQTRANKLAEITAGETNADITLAGNVASLTSKYQGEEADYASSNYNSAVKDYNSNQVSLAKTASKSTNLSQADTAAALKAGLESVKGADGHVSPGNLAKAYNAWTGQGLNPNTFWTYFQGYWNPAEGDYKQLFNAAK